jgi:hypothetical protein
VEVVPKDREEPSMQVCTRLEALYGSPGSDQRVLHEIVGSGAVMDE